jgi:pyridoxine 4-dehydrogenase
MAIRSPKHKVMAPLALAELYLICRSPAGSLAKPGSILDSIAKAHNATPSQIALAWGLKRSPVMLPIPGTSKVAHLEENVAALDIELSDEEFDSLDREGRTEYRQA